MNRPRILLADEPTGSLDENTRTLVFQLLLEMVAQEDITLVMATHERELAERCNRVIVMKDGKTHQRLALAGGGAALVHEASGAGRTPA